MIENHEQEARMVLTCDRCRAQATIHTPVCRAPSLRFDNPRRTWYHFNHVQRDSRRLPPEEMAETSTPRARTRSARPPTRRDGLFSFSGDRRVDSPPVKCC